MQTPFHWPVRIYHEDVDTMGVVYHSNYLKYYERARTEYLRAAGFDQSTLMEENDVMFVVRSMQIDFIQPARYDDELLITAAVTDLKRSQFVFDQAIYKNKEENIAASTPPLNTARAQVVCVSASRMRPIKIPEAILDTLICT